MVGEIAIAPIRGVNINRNMRRPIVILKEVDSGNCIVCPLTNQSRPQTEYIPIKAADIADGKLRRDLWAQANRAYTLNKATLTRIGALTADKTEEILDAFRYIFQ